MRKPAVLEHDLHSLLRERYSPRAFNQQPLASGTLRQLLEAARWAASCFNAQPWRFIVASRDDEAGFAAALSCLMEANQLWTKDAGAIIITVAQSNFTHNGKPNKHAWHDLGLAVGSLSAQAQSMGISLHQMAGFSSDKAREIYGIPEGYEPVTAIAVGYQGGIEKLPEPLQERERAPRTRLPQEQLVFAGKWGDAAVLDDETAYEEVLSFWFGELDENGCATDDIKRRWWQTNPEFDEELRQRYGKLHQEILSGQHGGWLRSARGRLAYVIVLDQFSRNMHRDTAEMYAADKRAVAVTEEALELALDLNLKTDERVFLYMPLMHAEDIHAQDRCVALLRELAGTLEGDTQKHIEQNVLFAKKHRDIVKDWGRFPHRNKILGRASTEEEVAFLKTPGSSF